MSSELPCAVMISYFSEDTEVMSLIKDERVVIDQKAQKVKETTLKSCLLRADECCVDTDQG